ncbi:gp53-like domain-containing protein [Rouxiella sp. Mn2063]|uniref:gp53-like domain-containing protein n=1 Tax=Rouxiella sp. Mn2063 TaxID=3395262 RepID=UPI003BE2EF10
MKRIDAPKKQPVPFGINGQRESLLPTTPAGDNTASYDVGFPPVTMILKAAGGLPPKGQDMNQILYELSALSRWFSSGAISSYDASFSSSIGGYPRGAIVIGDDGITRYLNSVDDNTTNPNSGGAGWRNVMSSPAFIGAPTAPTAERGDVSKQLATTEFVKGAGLQFNNILSMTTSGNIPLAYLGGEVVATGNGGISLNLPTTLGLSSGTYGKLLVVLNSSLNDVTVSAASSDTITVGNSISTSITVKPGDRAILSLAAWGFWHLIAGETSLKYSGSFGSSATINGYQKLPSGMIFQWGVTNNSSINPQTVNLPIAFPTAGLVIVASDVSSSYTPVPAISICGGRFLSNSQIQVATAYQYNQLGADSVQWFAIGY